jgi:hypothetical protein
VADRVSRAQRIEMANVAEREVMRYATTDPSKPLHALWHKHVHNVELDPMQVLKMVEMDRDPNTIDFSSRRTGKTAVKELYLLEHNATKADQEVGIVAPREAQSLVNLGYHLDAIRRSPILSAWIDHRSGRPQLADTYYRFGNRSVARAYGIMAQVDGSDLTAASLEEVDDMPRDRLYSRFLLTMGSTRRLGASKSAENKPQIRITGVFKGADTLSAMVDSKQYAILPVVDVYLGIELGIINRKFIELMRAELDPDEYIRQLLCKNVSSRNLIWQTKVRAAMALGLATKHEIVQPLPGARYRKRGVIGLGYDAGGHGENPTASRHCAVVVEMVGNFIVFLFCRFWPAGADDSVVKNALLDLWDYFRPDYALGDAYAVGMLSQLNDDLFARRMTEVDRRAIGDGSSTQSTWPEWAFSPIRFEGMVKHQMATALRGVFHHDHAVLPYFEDFDLHDPDTLDFRTLIRQLPNICAVPTKAAYPGYKQADSKIGDDGFDAAMAAVWAIATRGAAGQPAVILSTTHQRSALLPA